MTKFCPQCFRTYEDVDLDLCPEDDARLFSRQDRPDDPLMGTVLDGRFRIEEALSEGGMGAVYRATQLSVDREVALKVVRPELDDEDLFLERFFREARVVAELSHPNIVRLIDFGHDDHRDVVYLVMEMVRGTEMGELLRRGRLDPALALDVAYQVCAGLTEPHSQSVIHRDLKPANIILVPSSDGTFQVKILDFGIARTAEAGTRLTATGMICGTPAYLSPEQAQHLDVDERTDLYSLGVVLFEMLTGHLPFRGPSGLQLLLKHVQRPAPRLHRAYPQFIADPISALVQNLMEKEPEERPQTAMEVRRRIQNIRAELALSPVFLDDAPADVDDVEELFSPWIRPDLDPDRLEEVDRDTDPIDTSGESLLETLAAWEGAAEEEDGAEGEDDDEEGAEDSEMALMETVDVSRAEDAAAAIDTEETPDGDGVDDRPVDPPTAPRERAADSRFPVAVLVAGVLVIAALLAALAIPVFSDDTDETEEASPETAVAEEAVAEEDDTVASVDDKPRDDDTTAESPQQKDEGPAPGEDDADPTPGEDDADPGPDEEALPTEPDPVEIAEATIDDVPDETDPRDAPGSARPPGAPTAPSDTVHEGSIVLESPSEVESVEDYEEITGDLVVRINVAGFPTLELSQLKRIGGSLTLGPLSQVSTVSLPALEHVGGTVTISEGDHLETLDAPRLHTIGQHLMLNSAPLESLQLRALREVGGMLLFSQNSELSNVELPSLRDVGGALTVLQNDRLQTFSLPQLRDVGEGLQMMSGTLETVELSRLTTVGGGVTFNENDRLQVLDMGRLTRIGTPSSDHAALTINSVSQLRQLDLSSLQHVRDNLIIGSLPQLTHLDLSSLQQVGDQLTLSENTAVETIDLSALTNVGQNLLVTGHTALEQLTLPNLRNVDDLLVMNNPNLSSCDLRALADELKERGWDGEARLLNLEDSGCS